MSFTTRCPACGTVFRVVADQLKISDGWVRCGHCSDVFDATIHLQAWVPAAKSAVVDREPQSSAVAAPEPVPTPPPPPPPAPALVSEPVAAPVPPAVTVASPAPLPSADIPEDDDLRAWFGDGPLDAPAAAATPPAAVPEPTRPAPESAPESAPEPARLAEPEARVAETAPPLEPAPPASALAPDFQTELERFAQAVRTNAPVAALPASAREDRGDEAQEKPATRAADDAEDDVAAGTAVPGFMRQARRRAFWSSPGVRAALGTVALLLGAVLAAQWAVQQRHQLVASYPQARPWMEQACTWLGCDLAPIRRIEAVEIESAELVRRLGNFYSFDFVLRNRSSLEVATPALELTITGLGNQPMARRVFLPQDWPDAPAALPPGGTVSVSLRLALMLGDEAPTAGYRALAFYP